MDTNFRMNKNTLPKVVSALNEISCLLFKLLIYQKKKSGNDLRLFFYDHSTVIFNFLNKIIVIS